MFIKKFFILFFLNVFIFCFPIIASFKCGGILDKETTCNSSFKSEIKDGPTINFDSSVDPTYYNYFIKLLNTVYPYIVHFYGNCPYEGPINIKFDPNQPDWFFYDKSTNTIIISAYPTTNYRVDNDGDGLIDEDPFNGKDDDHDGKVDEDYNNDPSYDQQFTHEFIHSFHKDINITTNWIEEGMTEACTELISSYLYSEKIRDIIGRDPQKNIFLFDLFEENNFLSPTINFINSSIPDYYYDYSAAVFIILSSAYSDSKDIYNFTLLKTINENLRNLDCDVIDLNTFYDVVSTITYGKNFDGFESGGEFLRNLSINESKKNDISLILLPLWTKYDNKWYFSTVNPMNLTYFVLKRYIDDDGIERESFISSTNPLKVSLFKGNELILQKEYSLYSYPKNDWFFDTTILSDGVYKLEGQIVLDDGTLLSKSVHFLVSHTDVIPTLIDNSTSGFGIILLNRNGDILGNTLDINDTQNFETICSFDSGGTYKFLSDETKFFNFKYKNNPLSITIPTPFTRVAIKKISLFNIPLNSENDNSYTGITIINRHDYPLQVSISLLDENGNLILDNDEKDFENPIISQIPEKSEKIFITKNLFPIDWSENSSLEIFTNSTVEAFYMKGDYNGTFLDGSIPPEQLSKEITIPILKPNPYETEILLKNSHSTDAVFTLFLMDQNGNILDVSDTLDLPPNGENILNANDIFPDFDENCYIKINSSLSLFSTVYFYNGYNFAILSYESTHFSPTLIIPHIAMGGDYYTKIHLLSLDNSSNISIKVSIFDSTGNIIKNEYQLSDLYPGEKSTFNPQDILNSTKDYFDGWIKIEASGNILAYAEIGDIYGNFLTVQPAFKKLSNTLLFNHIAKGNFGNINYFTGLSIANPYPYDNNLEITIYDGVNPEPIFDSKYTLSPYSRFISLIGNENFFPDCEDMGMGYIDLKSDYPIAAYEIFGDDTLNFISSVLPFY